LLISSDEQIRKIFERTSRASQYPKSFSVDSSWLDESSFIAITSMVVGVENDDIRRDWWRIANLVD